MEKATKIIESGDLFENLANYNIMNVENGDIMKNELFLGEEYLITKNNQQWIEV